MKTVFYTQLFADGSIPIGARVVYSQIAFRATACSSESFNSDGSFNADSLTEMGGQWRDRYDRDTEIARDLNYTRQAVANCKDILKASGKIDEEGVFICDGMLDRFFDLKTETMLKGWELVVYSYISHKTQKYMYVDTSRKKLSEYFGLSESQLSHIVSSLVRKGWVTRGRDWRFWQLSCARQGC